MSMGLESILQSTPTGDDIALEMGDIKLQYNAALDDLKVVSASFESYIDACGRFLALCDVVEANEGMLEPTVLDFVNHNGALSEALGVSFAQEGFFTKIKNAFVSDDKFMFAAVKNGMGFNTPSGLSHGYEFYDSRKEAIIAMCINHTFTLVQLNDKKNTFTLKYIGSSDIYAPYDITADIKITHNVKSIGNKNTQFPYSIYRVPVEVLQERISKSKTYTSVLRGKLMYFPGKFEDLDEYSFKNEDICYLSAIYDQELTSKAIEDMQEDGKKITEQKQNIFRRMWEAIKSFIKKVLDGIGNFFHWLGSFFSPLEKKQEYIKKYLNKLGEKIGTDTAATESMTPVVELIPHHLLAIHQSLLRYLEVLEASQLVSRYIDGFKFDDEQKANESLTKLNDTVVNDVNQEFMHNHSLRCDLTQPVMYLKNGKIELRDVELRDPNFKAMDNHSRRMWFSSEGVKVIDLVLDKTKGNLSARLKQLNGHMEALLKSVNNDNTVNRVWADILKTHLSNVIKIISIEAKLISIIKQWQNEMIKFIDSNGKPDEASPPELIIRSKEEIEAMKRERERRQVIERARGSVATSRKIPEYV